MADHLPKAVWEGEFKIFGVTLRCYVLDNGKRIINAEDVATLFDTMGSGTPLTDVNVLDDFAKWIKGA